MIERSFMHGLRRTTLIATILTILCIVTIDQPFARWLATRETYASVWNNGIAWLEVPLGIEPYKWTGVWVLCIGCAATLFVPRLRRHAHAFLLVTIVHLLARNLTLWMKFGTGRLRPSEWLKNGGGDDTFWFWHDGWSFPSGHITLFASILFPLALAYPRTRPLLAIVAFAGVARIAVGAHFVSDVFGGVALTAAITWLCATWLRRALPSQIRPAYLQ
jgi:membrane-associated phospholipid phosphatase